MDRAPKPLLESNLIFSSAASSLKETCRELRRSNLSISNRFTSITNDATFVRRVAQAYGLPLVANERCGSWYIHPGVKKCSVYFKSTDGHFGQWSFSLRRLNVHLIDIVGRYGGCIIVDSTRRGKSMPDALSKTVPIWTAVLNRLLFPERGDAHALRTPPEVVSSSEHAQIEARLATCLEGARNLNLNVAALREKLDNKPMKSVWVTPTLLDAASREEVKSRGCHPVVLCTASSSDSAWMAEDPHYVQGAADDAESWSLGLDPVTFWKNRSQLLSTSEDALPDLIQQLLATRTATKARAPTLIQPTKLIWIADNAAIDALRAGFDIVISCSTTGNPVLSEALKDRYIHLACSTGKNGRRELRKELPKLQALAPLLDPASMVLVTCESGRDLAVGVALAIMCLYFDTDGRLVQATNPLPAISKAEIKHRLSWIVVSMPDAAPSRATLQSVNAYLMS